MYILKDLSQAKEAERVIAAMRGDTQALLLNGVEIHFAIEVHVSKDDDADNVCRIAVIDEHEDEVCALYAVFPEQVVIMRTHRPEVQGVAASLHINVRNTEKEKALLGVGAPERAAKETKCHVQCSMNGGKTQC